MEAVQARAGQVAYLLRFNVGGLQLTFVLEASDKFIGHRQVIPHIMRRTALTASLRPLFKAFAGTARLAATGSRGLGNLAHPLPRGLGNRLFALQLRFGRRESDRLGHAGTRLREANQPIAGIGKQGIQETTSRILLAIVRQGNRRRLRIGNPQFVLSRGIRCHIRSFRLELFL